MDKKLTAYKSMIVAAETGHPRKSGPGRWPVYAAAVGSGLALAATVGADSILYSGPQNITGMITGGFHGPYPSPIPINIDGIGGADFNLVPGWVEQTFNHNRSVRLDGLVGSAEMLINGSAQLKKLASGAVISAGAGTFTGAQRAAKFWRQTFFNGGGAFGGTWPRSTPGFAGVRLGSDYGWIRLSYTDPENDGKPNSVTAIDWALETTGQSIMAGDTGAPLVPEPATVPEPTSLMLLGTGAAGLLAWRRRRRQHAEKS